MEIDRELLEGCVKDMKSAATYLNRIKEDFKIPTFIQAMQLNLRIVELQEILENSKAV